MVSGITIHRRSFWVIVLVTTGDELASALGATLHIAIEEVDLASDYPAVVAVSVRVGLVGELGILLRGAVLNPLVEGPLD
jgi:hypothetical protein